MRPRIVTVDRWSDRRRTRTTPDRPIRPLSKVGRSSFGIGASLKKKSVTCTRTLLKQVYLLHKISNTGDIPRLGPRNPGGHTQTSRGGVEVLAKLAEGASLGTVRARHPSSQRSRRPADRCRRSRCWGISGRPFLPRGGYTGGPAGEMAKRGRGGVLRRSADRDGGRQGGGAA